MAKRVVSKPVFREYTIGQLVASVEKEELNKPEVVYEFSNGVKKLSTDRTDRGFYRR